MGGKRPDGDTAWQLHRSGKAAIEVYGRSEGAPAYPWFENNAGQAKQSIMIPFTDTPDKFSEVDLQRFKELVIKGGEVGGAALADNVANARILAIYREEGVIVGTTALKRPKASYREKTQRRSGIVVSESDSPYELGYTFLDDSLQGRRMSYPLVQAALVHADRAGVFATVRVDNEKMRRTLNRAGFIAAGNSWKGNEGRIIGLLIRPAMG